MQTGPHRPAARPSRSPAARAAVAAIGLWAVLTGIVPLSVTAQTEQPDDILVVANKSVKDDSLSRTGLKQLFLKQRTYWPSGLKALPIHAQEGSKLRAAFAARALDMTPAEEKKYWEELKIKSGLSAPPEFSNTLKAVFKLKGSVSYVFRSDYKEGVSKILLVIPAD